MHTLLPKGPELQNDILQQQQQGSPSDFLYKWNKEAESCVCANVTQKPNYKNRLLLLTSSSSASSSLLAMYVHCGV